MNTLYLSKRTSVNKIKRMIKKNRLDALVISKYLKKDEEYMKDIKKLNIPISDGRWLFKFLIIYILEYIAKCQKRKKRDLKIAFMCNYNSSIISYFIKEIISNVKNLKIITNVRRKFEKLEKDLLEECGSVLIITNSRRKALENIDIVINFDFSSKQINEFNLNNRMIIINLKDKIEINSKRFDGININYYEIDFNNKAIMIYEWIKDYNLTEIYESYLFQKNNIDNIINIIKKDKVSIKYLIGNNGKINEKEYMKLLDKRYKLD